MSFIDHSVVRSTSRPRGHHFGFKAPIAYSVNKSGRSTNTIKQSYRFSLTRELVEARGWKKGDKIRLLYDPGQRLVRLRKCEDSEHGYMITDNNSGKGRLAVAFPLEDKMMMPVFEVGREIESYRFVSPAPGVTAIDFSLPYE